MGVPELVLSAAGLLGGVVAMLVDGRNAVMIATVAVAAGLIPTALATVGGPDVLVLVGAAVAAVALGLACRRTAQWLPWASGPDPLIPAFSAPQRLFGSRSVRIWAAALAVPLASWVSFNVPIGEVTAVQGLLFPAVYAWACGALRLVVSRSIEDIGVGVAVIGLATALAWMIRGGPDSLTEAATISALAPGASVVVGWLSGRHARRQAT